RISITTQSISTLVLYRWRSSSPEPATCWQVATIPTRSEASASCLTASGEWRSPRKIAPPSSARMLLVFCASRWHGAGAARALGDVLLTCARLRPSSRRTAGSWRVANLPATSCLHEVASSGIRACVIMLAMFVLRSALGATPEVQASGGPETVVVHNGSLTLRGLLWRPRGRGPFPAILFNHGSGRSREQLERLGPYERQADALGPVFANHGYLFLYLFRRGAGLSADQGTNSFDLMNAELAAKGMAARNALQLQLLENRELSDSLSGLAFLRALPEVNSRAVAAIGHSFGGSLTLLLAEREPTLRAIVVFSGAGYSWDRSPKLRARLLAAVDRI